MCPNHGGGTPNVRRAAQIRLLDLVPVATRKHREVLEKSTDERVILKAVEMVYDRTGLEAKTGIGDVTVVREMVVGRLLALRGEEARGPEPVDIDEVFEAEIVDDDEGLTVEDLI